MGYLYEPVDSLQYFLCFHSNSIYLFLYLSLKIVLRFKVFVCVETPFFINKYPAEMKNKEIFAQKHNFFAKKCLSLPRVLIFVAYG